jgi:hypothetical protein
VSLFKKKKRYEGPEEEALRLSAHALRQNAHFQTFVEHIHERRETIIRNMQTEKVIQCTNRHFMESGRLEAMDELLDDLNMWSASALD